MFLNLAKNIKGWEQQVLNLLKSFRNIYDHENEQKEF